MIFITKNYYQNNLVFLFVFINTLLYTVVVSLIFFHSLMLIKVIIIKCFILILHRYGVLNYVISGLISLYYWYTNYPIGSIGSGVDTTSTPTPTVEDLGEAGEEKGKEKEKEKEKEKGEIAAICAMAAGLSLTLFLVVGAAHFVSQYYPDTFVSVVKQTFALTGAYIFIKSGVVDLWLWLMYIPRESALELRVDWEEAQKAAVSSPDAVLAVTNAKLVHEVLIGMKIHSSHYSYIINILRENNVPSMYILIPEDLVTVIAKIEYFKRSLGAIDPVFLGSLSNSDRIFYKILDAISPK